MTTITFEEKLNIQKTKFKNPFEFIKYLKEHFNIASKKGKELDINPIMLGTDEYKKINEIMKEKSKFVPYGQFLKELNS